MPWCRAYTWPIASRNTFVQAYRYRGRGTTPAVTGTFPSRRWPSITCPVLASTTRGTFRLRAASRT